MSYESYKHYNGNLYVSIAKDVKNQQLFMGLHVGITMDVKNWLIFTKPICKCYNGYKKTNNYYKTYMRVLHIWNGLYGNYNRKDVGIAQCSFWSF
jgi:hypothetical protein